MRVPEDERDTEGRRTHLVIRDLETKRSRRSLHLPTVLEGLLRSHRATQASEQLVAGPEWVESDLVFTTRYGKPIDPDNFARSFHRLCVRADLGHWTPHELRDSAASIMLAQGTPLWVVSEVLGHSSIAITKDTYGHLLGAESRRRPRPSRTHCLSPIREGESIGRSERCERLLIAGCRT